jgi:hypothetical protein
LSGGGGGAREGAAQVNSSVVVCEFARVFLAFGPNLAAEEEDPPLRSPVISSVPVRYMLAEAA